MGALQSTWRPGQSLNPASQPAVCYTVLKRVKVTRKGSKHIRGPAQAQAPGPGLRTQQLTKRAGGQKGRRAGRLDIREVQFSPGWAHTYLPWTCHPPRLPFSPPLSPLDAHSPTRRSRVRRHTLRSVFTQLQPARVTTPLHIPSLHFLFLPTSLGPFQQTTS